MNSLSNFEFRICKNHPYGEHITLTCVDHPNKKWSTKNIQYIGARSIFYSTWDQGMECSCPLEKLVHNCTGEEEGNN